MNNIIFMIENTMKIDLHVHTDISPCSHISFKEILTHAKMAGLDGIGITDHDTLRIRHSVKDGVQDNGLYVFIGMEYSTPQGDFLLFGPLKQVPSDLPAKDLLMWVNNHNAIAVAAHPFRANRPADEVLIKNKLCRIAEGQNGRNTDFENLKTRAWEEKYQIGLTGGSDAHETYEVGKCYTRFDCKIHNSIELVNALETGVYQPEAHPNHPILSKFTSACSTL